MIAAAVLFLAGIGPPELVTVGRCHWERPVAAVTGKAKSPGIAASAVVSKKPVRKKRVASQTPPKPGDEFVGCDEDGPVWTSEITSVEFWPEETPPVKLERAAPAKPTAPNTPEVCACGGGEIIVVDYPVFIGGGGGGYFPPVITAPIPEPSIWISVLAGLMIMLRRRRQ